MSTPQQIKKVAAKAAYGTVTPRRIKKAEEEEEEKEVAAGAVTPRRVTSAVTSIVSSNKVIEIYKEVLNNLENKNTIVKLIFTEKKINADYIGSFITFPKGDTFLEKFYGKDVDAKNYEECKKNLEKSLKTSRKNKLGFILGAVTKTDNISHHVSFIYDKTTKRLTMIDPGQISWGSEKATLIKTVATEAMNTVFGNIVLVEPFSTSMSTLTDYLCCKKRKCGPQDICRGTVIDEISSVFFSWGNRHRESFCQTWSIAMLVQLITQDDPEDWSYWDLPKKRLELYIRKFILYIVYIFPKPFQDWYNKNGNTGDYLTELDAFMKDYDKSLFISQPPQIPDIKNAFKHIKSKTKRTLSSRKKTLSSRKKTLSSRKKTLSSRKKMLSSRKKTLSSRKKTLSSRKV